MQTSIMEDVLKKLSSKLIKEKRNVILFLDNATCHPVTLDALLSNIAVRFLPKNTTSKLQMLDAGIIRCFKAKYLKKLVSYILSRINAGKSATEIIKDVDALRAIQWMQEASNDVSSSTIQKCFNKCGVRSMETD